MPVQGIWRHYRLLLFSQLLCVCGQHFGRQGVPLAAVNDTPVSSSAGAADASCQLSVLAAGPSDSSVSAVVVADVAVLVQATAKKRVDRLEALWPATDTFLPRS